jgi:hypothetical protein
VDVVHVRDAVVVGQSGLELRDEALAALDADAEDAGQEVG